MDTPGEAHPDLCAARVCTHSREAAAWAGRGLPGVWGLGGVSTLPREPPAKEVRKAAAWHEATHELVV